MHSVIGIGAAIGIFLNLIGYGPLSGFQQIYGVNFMQSVIASIFCLAGPYAVFAMLPKADAGKLYSVHICMSLVIASVAIFVFPNVWLDRIDVRGSLISPSYVQFTMAATLAGPFVAACLAWLFLSHLEDEKKRVLIGGNEESEAALRPSPSAANNEDAAAFGFDAARFKGGER